MRRIQKPILRLLAATFFMLVVAAAHASNLDHPKFSIDDEIWIANHIIPGSISPVTLLVKKDDALLFNIVADQKTAPLPMRKRKMQVSQSNERCGNKLIKDSSLDFAIKDDWSLSWWDTRVQIEDLGYPEKNQIYCNCNNVDDFPALYSLRKRCVHEIPTLVTHCIMVDEAKRFYIKTMDAGQLFSAKEDFVVAKTNSVENCKRDAMIFSISCTRGLPAGKPGEWTPEDTDFDNEEEESLASLEVKDASTDT